MHTQVASTSIAQYRRMDRDGVLTRVQKVIMESIAPYPRDYSLKELCMLTGLAINTVSGRVNELRTQKGELEFGPARRCSVTGKTVKPVRRINAQRSLF
ncbi:hypothetical protein MW7_007235 [Imbroritus primus]|uniref:Uncharacterized protein n=1 Tax=Imbroritus primus TaxID=3058603 RepID=A0ACD3SQJ1_9BURK|nr:hypothetical protein MW7_007235 [Burkholderiaceae bacterium PBA]